MKGEMSDNASMAVCVTAVAAAVAVIAVVCTLLVQRTSREHNREVRDYRVTCVTYGGVISHGDCLYLAKTP